MTPVALKTLKPGTLFKRKADALTVYQRGPYIACVKKYEANDYYDVCRSIELKGSTLVYVDFTF